MKLSIFCNLFVHDQKRFIVPCLDFKVYGVEQDFRMFMCMKRGKERPLKKVYCLQKIQKRVMYQKRVNRI